MNILERTGADISEMVICGGGAKSMFWRQMIADVYGVNVKSAECGEGPAYGAAALGAVACGAFSTVESVCEKWIRFSSVTESDKSAHGQYIKMYELYSKLYPSLKDIFSELGKAGK